MAKSALWKVILVAPGEREVALLAELTSRGDTQLVAIVDPSGDALGTAIAEVMGVPVFRDLSDPAVSDALYLVYPNNFPLAEYLGRQASALGMKPLSSQAFRHRLQRDTLRRRVAPPAPQNFETLEHETETIHRTLSRIEEALHRESLLRWLLSLATRAVRATSGSIMLYDEKTEELYIAYAYGLSESTLHATRVALGDGISGRVAQQLRSELVRGRSDQAGTTSSDRPDIAAAISVPLTWEGQLLGVLNVSIAEGDPDLTDDDLATCDRLARRMGLILHRFLDLQKAQTGEMFHTTDQALQEMMQRTEDLHTVLSAWAGTLCLNLEASSCSLAVVCDDGSLLVAEGQQDGDTRIWYETARNQAWNDVRASGRPLVVRQTDPAMGPEGRLTAFYLPVGGDPVLAILTLVFGSAAEAHRFHTVSGDIIYLLEKRLSELIRQVNQHDRLQRLTELTNDLTTITLIARQDTEQLTEMIVATAKKLAGAQEVYLVTAVEGSGVRLAGENRKADQPWLKKAGKLLQAAQQDGWQVTLLSDSSDPRTMETCLLSVPSDDRAPAPGLILFGKERVHALDGGVFTAFDASMVQRLARLLNMPSQPLPEAVDSTEPQETPDTIEAVATPVQTEPTTSTAPAADESIATTQREIILDVLRREMDRCDRYHTTFALTAFAPQAQEWDLATAQIMVSQLAKKVRSSDHVSCLDDGILLIIVPEDIQALSRQQRRLITLMRNLSGQANLHVSTSNTIYPGKYEDSARLLDETLAALHKGT